MLGVQPPGCQDTLKREHRIYPMKIHAPHISVRAVQPVVAALEALGYKLGALLDKAKIPREVLRNADEQVPHSAMMQLWQHARVVTGDENLGIHLAEAGFLLGFRGISSFSRAFKRWTGKSPAAFRDELLGSS